MTCRRAIDQSDTHVTSLPERLTLEARINGAWSVFATPEQREALVAAAIRAALDAAKVAVRRSYERDDESPLEALARAAAAIEALKG